MEQIEGEFFKTGDYVHYSERTCEFFSLVHQKMFPLLEGWNEDPETDFENFYIFSLNHDLCCEEIEYEYLHVSYAAGLIFIFGTTKKSGNFSLNNTTSRVKIYLKSASVRIRTFGV